MARRIDMTHLQKFCGISYRQGGFAFDRYARQLSDITKLMYWDHMHTLSASGGIGQFTLNAAAVKLARCGFSMKQLGALTQMVKLPKCWGTLHPRFSKTAPSYLFEAMTLRDMSKPSLASCFLPLGFSA